MFAGKKSAQIREILISESAWEEMTCLFAPSLTQGIRIPQDIAVLGYDNLVGIGNLFLPPLSTVQLPHYEIGRLSTLHIINGDTHRDKVIVESPWLPRESI